MTGRTHYETLGVMPTADQAVVDAAYAALARKRVAGTAAARELEAAYAVLRDPAARAQYDAAIRARLHTGGSAKPVAASRGSWTGWILTVLVAAVVAAVMRSGSTAPSPTLDTSAVQQFVAPPPAAARPALVDVADLRRAARHAGLALGAEGTSGAMVYSLACYASLTMHFSLGKLDQCASFDSLAGRMRSDPVDLPVEAAYFETDAAALRHANAAAAAGVPADIASLRLAAVLEMAGALTVEPVEPPMAPPGDSLDADDAENAAVSSRGLDELGLGNGDDTLDNAAAPRTPAEASNDTKQE